jgi:uncharacterized protein YciI
MANITLFAAVRNARELERITPALLLQHLVWMVEQEGAGRLFASGPFLTHGKPPGAGGGLTIVRAADEQSARALLDGDPLIHMGAVDYKLYQWALMEGTLVAGQRLSQHRADGADGVRDA